MIKGAFIFATGLSLGFLMGGAFVFGQLSEVEKYRFKTKSHIAR